MNKIKRIVFPVRRYVEGTAAINRLLAYAKGFAELGMDVWLFFFITNENEDKVRIDNPKIHYVYLWEDNSNYLRKHRGLALVKNLFAFRKKIQNDDVVFLPGRENYMFAITCSIRRRIQIFCETTEHPEYNGSGFLRRINNNVSLFFIKRIDGLFVISQTLRDYFLSKGVKEEKICVVNMFVDKNRFVNVVKNTDKKYIAYCGYVSIRKDGVDVLIKAFSKFHALHPEYQLYIIGRAGFPEPLTFFENLAEEYDVKGSVVFTGEVGADEMPQLLVNAEILALARPDSLQARNGFPTKLGEYLSTGNPIVVTSVGEIPHFIKHGINGFLAKESNVDDFSEKLCWAAENIEQAKVVGTNGKKLVDYEFSYLEQCRIALSFIKQNL